MRASMSDTLVLVTMHVSRSDAPRHALVRRAAVLAGAPLLALLSAPAHADVPEGWGGETSTSTLDFLPALGVFLGAPLLLFVLIGLAVYLPAMVRGDKLLPDHTSRAGDQLPEGQWIGGPRQGVAELPGPDGDDSRAGGARGSW